MNKIGIVFGNLDLDMLSSIPELRAPIENTFGGDYDLEKETPGEYPIFEDVVQKFLFNALNSDQVHAPLLERLFNFFEKMAISGDRGITDLLGIAILEPLVNRSALYQKARRYMGRKTMEFSETEERRQREQTAGGAEPAG